MQINQQSENIGTLITNRFEHVKDNISLIRRYTILKTKYTILDLFYMPES